MCEHTRDCKQLYAAMFSFLIFEMFYTNKLLVNNDLIASKFTIKKHCQVSMCVIITHSYELNFYYLSYSKPANTFISKRFVWKFFEIVKTLPCSCFMRNKTLGCMLRALYHVKHSRQCFNICVYLCIIYV